MVNERMLERIESENAHVSISVNDTGTIFSFEMSPNQSELYMFSVTANEDIELYTELYAYLRNFDGPDKAKVALEGIVDSAREFCSERESLLLAATNIKAGDAFSYQVGNVSYNAVAAENASVNFDADEPEWEIQMEGGGAVTLDSLDALYPNIANHIKDSARDYDVSDCPELDADEKVLELPIQMDELGVYALSRVYPDRQADKDALLRFYKDMACEIVAYGKRVSGGERAAWIYPVNSEEAADLLLFAEKAIGEPVAETVQRMLYEDEPKPRKQQDEIDR